MTTYKVAIITGGASGIGLAVALALNQRGGWRILLLDCHGRAAWPSMSAFRSPGALIHELDVTNWEQLSESFEMIFRAEKRIDFVFANAGVMEAGNFYDEHPGNVIPPKPNMAVLDVNLKGVIMTSYLALHYLRQSPSDNKNIVLTASSSGIYPGSGAPLYAGSKHGVVGFMRSIASKLAAEGIRINAICPGPVETGLLDKATWEATWSPELFTSKEFVAELVVRLIDGNAMVDMKDNHIEAGKLYGRVVELSANKFYFRERPEYCDAEMAQSMVARVVEGR